MAGFTRMQNRPVGDDGIYRDWEPGDVFLDLYEVISLPGTERGYAEGGMGRVNLVRHRQWHRDLAVKSVLPSRSASVRDIENFATEAQQWVDQIGLHPNVVACYYVRVLGSVPRVFIEYVDGGTLADWIESKHLYAGGPQAAAARILDVAIQMAWGLHYVHELGLVHQDVKPLNVMMTNGGLAKVTDFGLANAKAVIEAGGPDTGTILATWGGMTPAYCSPEQAEAAAKLRAGTPRDHLPKLTRRTDVWSWAASVLHMFRGEIAWPAGQVAHVGLQRDPNDSDLPAMPPAVKELLQACFQRRAEDRPHDLMTVANTLQAIYRQVTGQSHARVAPLPNELLADTRNNQAVSLMDLNRHTTAVQRWQEALAIDPHHPEATYNSSLVAWRSGRLRTAELLQQMREAQSTRPDDPGISGLLAQLYLDTGYFDRALSLVEPLSDLTGVHPEISQAIADLRSRAANIGRCVRSFKGPRAVSAAALSANGRVAVSGHEHSQGKHDNDTLWVWDVATTGCLRTLPVRAFVHAVALSADGRLALSAISGPSMWEISTGAVGEYRPPSDQVLQLWDTSTGQCLRAFGVADEAVQSIALSADGRLALSGDSDNSARLWDTTTGVCLRTFAGQSTPVLAVALSADNRRALVAAGPFLASQPSTLYLWDTSGGLLQTIEGAMAKVCAVSLDAEARWVLTGSDDAVARLWDAATARCVRTLEGHTSRILSAVLSADGARALTGSEDGTIRLWDTATGRCLRTYEGHAKDVTSVCLSTDGQYALTGSRDKLLKWWQLPTTFMPEGAPLVLCRPLDRSDKQEAAFETALATARKALAQGDAPHAASAVRAARALPGRNRHPEALELWQAAARVLPRESFTGGWLDQTYHGHGDWVGAVALSGDDRWAVSASGDKTIRLWDVKTGQCIRTFLGHTELTSTVALSADGRWAISGGADCTIRLWDVQSGDCVRIIQAENHSVRCVALSPDGRWALTGGDLMSMAIVGDRLAVPGAHEATARLWDVATGRCVRTFPQFGRVYSVSFSPDGRYLLGTSDKTLELWDLATNKRLRSFEGHTNLLYSGTMSRDGQFAVSASTDKSVRLWEVSTGKCLKTFRGHTDRAVSAVQSPDGRWVLSGSWDKTIRLWDASTGNCVRTFEGHAGWVNCVRFSHDGSFMVSASADKTLRRWNLDWELANQGPSDPDRQALPYLTNFLTLQTPYSKPLPTGPKLTSPQVRTALTRSGTPTWTDQDLHRLVETLSEAGLGCLESDKIQHELQKMASSWQEPPPAATS